MTDLSHLDNNYFIDAHIYNCPYCKRNNVSYVITDIVKFDQTNNKECYAVFTKCGSCKRISLHLTNKNMFRTGQFDFLGRYREYSLFDAPEGEELNIDKYIFHNMPSSSFVIDERIPKNLRELLTEAETSINSNLLTGASACIRKAIYTFLKDEELKDGDYKDKIKELKTKYSTIDEMYFEILGSIQGITSDSVHENSYEQYTAKHASMLLMTLQDLFLQIFVLPAEIKAKRDAIAALYQKTRETGL